MADYLSLSVLLDDEFGDALETVADTDYPTSSQLCKLNLVPLNEAMPTAKQPVNCTTTGRFSQPVSAEDLEELRLKSTPPGTRQSTSWAYNTRLERAVERNQLSETYGEKFPHVPKEFVCTTVYVLILAP